MPRPCKQRRICMEPQCSRFGPKGVKMCGSENRIMLTLDEYEAIRLIDLEGKMQEDCAARMDVARTTVQAIYANARRKIADSIINGKELVIQGGDIILCDGKAAGCGCGQECPRRRFRKNKTQREVN
jgi:uncharacterized protein